MDNMNQTKENDRKSNIIFSPDFEALKEDIEKLKTEMSMLLLEHDELIFVECKNIEAAYMLTLGNLEYKAFELHCAVLRLKRKIELIQAKKNRQEKVVISAIEKTLDNEFAEYQALLNEQIEKMNSALEREQCKSLSEKETLELKKLYRSVIKSLHPDLHPDISEAKMKLFHNAVRAYENGNLTDLRIISSMVEEPVLSEISESSMATLAREKERLSELLKALRKKIERIKSEYPYTMKPILQSEEKIAEKEAELEELISALKEALAEYEAKLAEMSEVK